MSSATIFTSAHIAILPLSLHAFFFFFKMCLQIVYLIYMYKQDLAVNNLQVDMP